jgi:glucose-6-phosphate 1-dehydrogenase
MIDSWRWQGVPFYLRAGKKLAERLTEVNIHFRAVPLVLFKEEAAGSVLQPAVLTLRIQPHEGISLRFVAKVPGTRVAMQPVKMDFLYGTSFGQSPPEAYERLLLDCLLGDQTLFARADEVEAAWGLIDPILRAWAESPPTDFPSYEAGTWGPGSADRLLGHEGRAWRRP